MSRARRCLSVLLIGCAVVPTTAGPPPVPNDPYFASQWALQNIGQEINGKKGKPGADIRALSAWDIYQGSLSIVAIVASGVDPHPEFADRLLEGYVAPSAGGDPYSTLDTAWVGTHVAGIIGAARGNGVGIAGLNDKVWLLPIRALQGNVSGTEASVAEGIEWAVDYGAHVIVVPHQFYVGTPRLADAIAYASAHDVVVVAPAGHTGGNDVAFPAAFEECIAVSSTTNGDTLALFSNYGPQVDLSAPSQNIWSTRPGGVYGFETQPGSASAAAYVAGVASLIRSYAPQLSAEAVRQILIDSADDLGVLGGDQYFGAGRLNALRALELTPLPALRFEYVDPLPTTIPPNTVSSFTIRIADGAQTVVPASAALVYRTATSGFATPRPLRPLGGGLFAVDFPAEPCDTTIDYYLTAQGSSGAIVTEPLAAPASLHSVRAIRYEQLFDDDFEDNLGWDIVTEGGSATKGAWTRVIPVGTSAQPAYDYSADYGRYCFITGQHFGKDEGLYDVDGGPVRLITPVIPLTTPDAEVAYSRWFYTSTASGTPDVLTVEMSRDGGVSWVVVETVEATQRWTTNSFRLREFPDAVGDQLRVRFTTSDIPNNSLTEAAIDEFHVRAIECSIVRGDTDGDGDFDLYDFRMVGDCWQGPISATGSVPCSTFDYDGDGDVDLRDFRGLQNQFHP